MIIAVELSTVAVLAAISLSEGIGRVPAGALVLRRSFLGPWRVASTSALPDRLQVVHWWPPLFETLVVPRPGPAGLLPGDALRERLASTSRICRAARIVGAVTLITLVVGIPLGLEIAGWLGGLIAAMGVVTGQLVQAIIGWRGLRALGASLRARWRLVAVILNPFAAPAAASRILALAAAGAAPVTVARVLLPPDAWASWFRPQAYDARLARTSRADLARELEDADSAIAAVLANRPAATGNDCWCPRCGATYQAGFTTCAECEVALEGSLPSPPRNSKC